LGHHCYTRLGTP